MKANELRIGSLIFVNGEEMKVSPAVITLQHLKDKHTPPLSIPFCEPIPLTAEWLEWLGFEERLIDGLSYMVKTNDQTYFFKWYHDNEIDFSHPHTGEEMTIHYNVSTVHQLQNLFFALTGEELTNNK